MKRFKDGLGREWDITMNTAQVKKLRNVLNIDIDKIDQPEGAKVFSDVVLFVDMLYVLCEKQCSDRAITDVQFGEGLVGDSIDLASHAFIDEVSDFFPVHRRTILRAIKDKGEVIRAQAMEKALNLIDGLTLSDLTSSK